MDFFTHAIEYATIEDKCILAMLLIGIILIPIISYFYECREKKRIQMEKEEIAQITANIEKARRMLSLMRPNMLHRYEEKKAEGLAELDNWCRHYNMSIIEMEEFLGLSKNKYSILLNDVLILRFASVTSSLPII